MDGIPCSSGPGFSPGLGLPSVSAVSGATGYKVGAGALVENEAGRLAGIVLELPAGRAWKIEIRARYSHGQELKDLRVITGGFTLTFPGSVGRRSRLDGTADPAWIEAPIQAGLKCRFRLD